MTYPSSLLFTFLLVCVQCEFAIPLVLSDLALRETVKAETIVHFDLPVKSKKMFGAR